MKENRIIDDVRNREDVVLVERAQKGDRDAFNDLLVRYQDMVFSICYRVTGDYDVAHDCAQETFLRVFKKLKSFRGKSKFSTWLYTVTVNTCRNFLSSSYYKKEFSTINVVRDGEVKNVVEMEVPDTRSDPEEDILSGEVEDAVQDAISKLPFDLRAVVVMKDLEGKTYEEVGETLKMKTGTVKSKCARARNHLRKSLRDIAL